MISNNQHLEGDGLMNMATAAFSTGWGEICGSTVLFGKYLLFSVCIFAFFLVRKFIPNSLFVSACGTILQLLVAISIALYFPTDATSHVTVAETVFQPT